MRVALALALCIIALTLATTDARRKHKTGIRQNGKPKCKYSRKAAWTECGPGVLSRQRVVKLKRGDPTQCAATLTETKLCKHKNDKKKSKNGRRKNGRRNGCKYSKGPWSDCNPSTKTRTRLLNLRKGDPAVCQQQKTISRKCKKACKYSKGDWQPCSNVTNTKTRVLTLKKGDPSVCNATRIIQKPCRAQGASNGVQTSRCRYEALPWGECDLRTNTMTRILQLKAGNPALCQASKQLTRKCRSVCKFSKGNWTECDEATNLRRRTDHLIKGDPSECESRRVITKKCKSNDECVYDVGDWSECDRVSGKRTRVKKLSGGDPIKCQLLIRSDKPCLKSNGEESCFLGNWGEYGPCMNGVMMKHRPVIAGGVECERKAVKTKPCS